MSEMRLLATIIDASVAQHSRPSKPRTVCMKLSILLDFHMNTQKKRVTAVDFIPEDSEKCVLIFDVRAAGCTAP